MTEVVAVADHAGRQARFVAGLSSAFGAVGIDLAPRTQRELATEVSISQSTGRRPVVDPDRPLLWLCPADPSPSDAPDDRFLSAEAHSAARSVATLNRSPVLNQPERREPLRRLPARAPARRAQRSTLRRRGRGSRGVVHRKLVPGRHRH
jgi:hypothetical protein